MTEQELREKIESYFCRDACCVCDGECSNAACLKGMYQKADAILALIKKAGYVQLTRDEADILITCFENESLRRYGKVAKEIPILAKLKARLEVADA